MHVFISYTREKNDQGVVSLFYERYLSALCLYNTASSVFLDTVDIRTGDRFAKVIDKNLEHADVFLPLLSPAWLMGDWCQKEYQGFCAHKTAQGKPLRVVPLLWVAREDFTLPNVGLSPIHLQMFGQFMDEIQCEDWSRLRLGNWNETELKTAVANLARLTFSA